MLLGAVLSISTQFAGKRGFELGISVDGMRGTPLGLVEGSELGISDGFDEGPAGPGGGEFQRTPLGADSCWSIPDGEEPSIGLKKAQCWIQ
jgi:hypothetical protein